jgi:hypothetical protein
VALTTAATASAARVPVQGDVEYANAVSMLGLGGTVPSRPLRDVGREEAALRALVADALLAVLSLSVVSSEVVAVVQRQLDGRAAPRALAVGRYSHVVK